MNRRLTILSLCLIGCLALGLTLYGGIQIVQAAQRAQHSHQLVITSNVQSLRPWMTLHYIARVYHVPESYLLQTLAITDAASVRHVTLQALAGRLHMRPTLLIQQLQAAIIAYRQQHPESTPTMTDIRRVEARA